MPDGTTTAHLYLPKLATALSEGYGRKSFRSDILAAITVAAVALPLSMAIAVASGVSPVLGLYTSIIGGFLVSALGGSRFQIGGPAGAFIVLVSATVSRFGFDGLVLTVLLSGVMLTFIGASGIGMLIRHIPHPVTVGFTCGIAVTILASQLRDLGGLTLSEAEPGPLLPKLFALAHVLSTFNGAAFAVGVTSAALIFALRLWRPNCPGMLVAIVAASIAAAAFHLPLETVGSHFGAIPEGLPAPRLPSMTWSRLIELLPSALSFTLLGGIESLLSAKVADGMTGRKHRSNMELMAQGLANVASAVFGGISVTGTIARTATNIRAGAHSPLAGMMHAGFVLLFIVAAGPLVSFIPLSALAGVLVVVCWNMAEKDEVWRLLRQWGTGTVFAATFAVTALKDLTLGILVGCVVAAAFALAHRPVPEEGEEQYPPATS